MKHLIFENRRLAPLPHRIGWTFFTAIFWILWLYLLLPLFTLLLWVLGLASYVEYFGWTVFFEFDRMINTALTYSLVVFILGGSLLLWARVEFMRFRDRARRGIPVAVSSEEIALFTKLPVEKIELWKTARRIVIDHDLHGNLHSAQ